MQTTGSRNQQQIKSSTSRGKNKAGYIKIPEKAQPLLGKTQHDMIGKNQDFVKSLKDAQYHIQPITSYKSSSKTALQSPIREENTVRLSSSNRNREKITSQNNVTIENAAQLEQIGSPKEDSNKKDYGSGGGVRGILQREFVDQYQKRRQLEQKNKLSEMLNNQIEEKKRKAQREKELENQRCQQDDERLQRQNEEEDKAEEQEKIKKLEAHTAIHKVPLKKIQTYTNLKDDDNQIYVDFAKMISSPDHRDSKQSITSNYTENNVVKKFDQNIIDWLKRENEDLKQMNQRKDSLIQKLMIQSVKKPLIKPEFQVNRTNSSQSTQFLRRSVQQPLAMYSDEGMQTSIPQPLSRLSDPPQYSQDRDALPPKSQQQHKINLQYHLPTITTPQPNLSHPKMKHNSVDIVDGPLSVKHQYRMDDQERLSDWSFGRSETILNYNTVNSYSQKSYIKPILQSKRKNEQINDYVSIQKFSLLNNPSEDKTSLSTADSKTKFLKSASNNQLQIASPDTTLNSNFLQANPAFTFCNLQNDKNQSFGGRKLKDKLPKEFQIVPLKRKFFV